MFIRSQSKKLLVELKGALFIKDIRDSKKTVVFIGNAADTPYEVIIRNDGVNLILGQYSTEEKAIHVLDEIAQYYKSSLYSDHAFDNAARVQRPYIFMNNKVYQMPHDEDVIL